LSGDFGPRHPRPKTWADILAITGGLSGVPIEEIEAGRVDWEYQQSAADMRKCGRKGCQRDHAHGWIVALPGNRYVNIGNDCACKYANADKWSTGVKRYREQERTDARDAAILEARDQAQRVEYWLSNDPEIKKAIALYMSWCDQAKGSLHQEIVRRAEKGKCDVERFQKLTTVQMEQRRVMLLGGRVDQVDDPYIARAETVKVATLKGLECFRPLNNPVELRRRLLLSARQLLVAMPAEENSKKVKELVSATRELVPLKNALVKSVRAAQAFFTTDNFAAVMQLDQIKPQGITAIELGPDGTVLVSRRPNWDIAA